MLMAHNIKDIICDINNTLEKRKKRVDFICYSSYQLKIDCLNCKVNVQKNDCRIYATVESNKTMSLKTNPYNTKEDREEKINKVVKQNK